jgi:hypothetical protein
MASGLSSSGLPYGVWFVVLWFAVWRLVCHDAVLACVFYSLPTEVLSGGFAEGRMYEKGLVLWTRKQSEYCQDLNYNNGGGGRTPKEVARWGGSAWFTGGPTEVVAEVV